LAFARLFIVLPAYHHWPVQLYAKITFLHSDLQ
jgi:hypothetical protein